MYEKPKTKYEETMWAEHATDVYAGTSCDQHKSGGWIGYADGDREDGLIHETKISHHIRAHPRGTIIVVKEPVCGRCKLVRSICQEEKKLACAKWWENWENENYS